MFLKTLLMYFFVLGGVGYKSTCVAAEITAIKEHYVDHVSNFLKVPGLSIHFHVKNRHYAIFNLNLSIGIDFKKIMFIYFKLMCGKVSYL